MKIIDTMPGVWELTSLTHKNGKLRNDEKRKGFAGNTYIINIGESERRSPGSIRLYCILVVSGYIILDAHIWSSFIETMKQPTKNTLRVRTKRSIWNFKMVSCDNPLDIPEGMSGRELLLPER